jgi:hypothetical protein
MDLVRGTRLVLKRAKGNFTGLAILKIPRNRAAVDNRTTLLSSSPDHPVQAGETKLPLRCSLVSSVPLGSPFGSLTLVVFKPSVVPSVGLIGGLSVFSAVLLLSGFSSSDVSVHRLPKSNSGSNGDTGATFISDLNWSLALGALVPATNATKCLHSFDLSQYPTRCRRSFRNYSPSDSAMSAVNAQKITFNEKRQSALVLRGSLDCTQGYPLYGVYTEHDVSIPL